MILSVEPLETLRYLDYLRPDGRIISSSTPFINIPDYPDLANILPRIQESPGHLVVDSERLAREAGSARTQNMVMLGAASPYLIVAQEDLLEFIRVLFKPRGEGIVSANIRAFELGRAAAEAQAPK